MRKMENTKEKILHEAVALYVRKGYGQTSMRNLAEKLGITVGALYKHYRSKQDIFETVLHRMEELDRLFAERCGLPEQTYAEAPESYRSISRESIVKFTLAMFRHWTSDPFPAAFRKILTQEQYHSKAMATLYQQYFGQGPLEYIKDLFRASGCARPEEEALRFYSIFHFMLGQYDTSGQKSKITEQLKELLS